MKDRYNVLFVCTRNSARRLMAETLANRLGGERIRAFSAGNHPDGRVHPGAVRALTAAGLATSELRSKSWDEFTVSDAPVMDLIITVCDRAAGETCPNWPGHPVTAHWSIPDPAAVEGTPEQSQKAFSMALQMLQHRIALLLSLRPEAWDRLSIESHPGKEVSP